MVCLTWLPLRYKSHALTTNVTEELLELTAAALVAVAPRAGSLEEVLLRVAPVLC